MDCPAGALDIASANQKPGFSDTLAGRFGDEGLEDLLVEPNHHVPVEPG